MMDIQKVSIKILNLISEIDEFKGKWEVIKSLAPDRLSVLRHVATIASIGSSTRIEGSQLSDIQVEQLLQNIQQKSFRSRDEEEVGGYAEAMNLVFNSFEEIKITENYIKQFHSILLKYSSKDLRHKGEYKKLSNNVEAFDRDGKSIGIIFKTATPFDTPFKMKELIEWYNHSIYEEQIHPLIVVAVFIVRFLAIHPFQDGNGRLSRIITTLMLLKCGYNYVPYCSLESIIEENKEQYYLALRSAQKTIDTDNSTIEDWLIFFLGSLRKQKEILFQRIKKEKLVSHEELSELSKEILSITKMRNRTSISDIVSYPNANRNTIKKHIRELVNNGFLVKHGSGKGTWYVLGK
jgi:Fic family protein